MLTLVKNSCECDNCLVMSKRAQEPRKNRNMFAFALIVQKRGKVQEDRRDRRSGEVADPYEGWEEDVDLDNDE